MKLTTNHTNQQLTRTGKRVSISTRKLEKSKEVIQFLEQLGVVYKQQGWYPGYVYDKTFTVFLNADRRLLELRAEPTQGNIQVLQGEYAITHAKDQNPILSTHALDPCAGVLLYDPLVRGGGIAHIDYAHETPETIEEMIKKLEAYGDHSFVFGTTPNTQFILGLKNKYKGRFIKELELPKEFSFDTRDGKLYPFTEAYDPTLERRLERVRHRLSENITPVFCMYEPKR